MTAERALAEAEAADAEIAAGRWRGPLHGVPFCLKDIVQTDGHPHHRRLLHPGRLGAGGGRHGHDAARRRRRRPARQGQHPRVRLRRHDLEPARPDPQPLGPRARRRRLLGRLRGGARRRARRVLDRQRHGGLDPRPGRLLRHRRPQAELGPGERCRRGGAVLHLGPYRPDGAAGRGPGVRSWR